MEQYNGTDRENIIYQITYEKLQNGIGLSEEEREALLQNNPEAYRRAMSVEKENEDYRLKLKKCRTKEEVQRIEEEYRKQKLLGLSLIENNEEIPVENKLEHTLFKDAKVSAIKNITRQFIESEAYEKLPTDTEYIEKFGNLSFEETEGIHEGVEVQYVRARKGYAKVRHLAEEEEESQEKF